jgi:23S rRNA (guanosine2251-2'-O)-methyltransferase
VLIYGRNAVLEALRQGQTERVMVARGVHPKLLAELRKEAARVGADVEEVPRVQLDQALRTTQHQGVAAELPEVRTGDLRDAFDLAAARGERPLLVLLDHLTDPRNVGAIVRSAEALGAHGVVTEERRSAPLSAVVVKASAGATSLLPVVVVKNLARTIDELKERGVWVYGAAPSGPGAVAPELIDWDRDAALVIGSEGSGMRRLVAERCDGLVTIPMTGRIGSLNASVAAGILLYAVARGRERAAARGS